MNDVRLTQDRIPSAQLRVRDPAFVKPTRLSPQLSGAAVAVVVPNAWQGEPDCIVGPFSGRTVAEYFANSVVDFGHFETVSRHVFVKGDSWYVEVSTCRVAPTLHASQV